MIFLHNTQLNKQSLINKTTLNYQQTNFAHIKGIKSLRIWEMDGIA